MTEPDLARFRWLLPGARPPIPLPRRQERVFLLIGLSIMFGGYDLNIFGLALPQIQASLHIPENMAGVTVSLFRLAAIPALLLALSADVFGRRRLLLITVTGEAIMTVASAFARDYNEFVWCQIFARLFGYNEELLAFVVIAEEIDERVRGWANGTLGAMNALGAGLASLVFAAINILPFGWRAIYLIGGGTLVILTYYRRYLPETQRFELRRQEIAALDSRLGAVVSTLGRLLREHPGRLLAMMAMVASMGYAIGPATVLMAKYLQQDQHYAPAQVTLLYMTGGLIAVAGNIFAGRLSDRLGRKPLLFFCMLATGGGFAMFYGGASATFLPAVWIVALFGYMAGDSLMAGLAVEIFPTAYRATVSGVRYLSSVLAGALGLALEGRFYDLFGAHGPAIRIALLTIPMAMVALFFLPEAAGIALEEVAEQQ